MSEITTDKNKDAEFATKFRDEFIKDVEHRKQKHLMMNFHYLQYKGILSLNSIYGEEYLKNIGLQVNVPRTFMTIESIRPSLSGRPLDISVFAHNKKEYDNRDKARDMLMGEWRRSKADFPKADAEWNGLVFGTGWLLWYYAEITKQDTDVFDGYDEEGKIKYKKGKTEIYKGMRCRSLNPYYVFPDHTATTEEEEDPGTWGHCYVYSIWDFEAWKDECKARGYSTEGMEEGGHLEEYDAVRRTIDAIYTLAQNNDIKTRDSGTLTTARPEITKMDTKGKIGVIERYEPNSYSVCSGANWTVNHKGTNPHPDKKIQIKPIRDYRVPDEFDGIGEPEVVRWQQYEENKVHNLAFMQVLITTIPRYGIIEEFLVDPTEAKMSNPFKPIRLKNIPTGRIEDAIQILQQKSPNDFPERFLGMIKDIHQASTGANDFFTGANKPKTNTLGEAELMKGAGSERMVEKVSRIEERDLVPILESWLACIPQFYTDEMDLLLNDGEDFFVRYVPYNREFNTDTATVSKLSVQNGISGATTIEEVYLKMGYRRVVFVSDIIGRYNLEIKTAYGGTERQKIVDTFLKVINLLNEQNVYLAKSGQQPKWDTNTAIEDVLRQFPEIVKNVDTYKLQTQPIMAAQVPPQPSENLSLTTAATGGQ